MKNKQLKALLIFTLVLITPKISFAMHIMEGYLSPKWAIFWTIIALPFVIKGMMRINQIVKKEPKKKMLLALVGAFVFILSALKIPSVTGSSSHPTGVGLGAILFGPTVMSFLGVIVLLFQALLLAHGGITTLGANTFSMAIAGPIVAYLIFKIMSKQNIKKDYCVFLAAALGDLVTYMVTSVQLAIAYPDPNLGIMASLGKFMSIFAVTQIPLAVVEGIITVIVYNMISEYSKEGDELIESLQ
ncbi:energy-coupling factor ABC transporter permease [Clostridium sp. D2Q-14]|uniref:energy-coupling factor ABC transporter permease n=1 Tax=Anaeromonas gelatinilytica TaxID=2683194 RepID=UPI00193B14B5|nr:energy-coupling factor ABC transporter permease [Anaeromonas gelatinilytica]MBS4535474.1 energy-coupling factor ABC transporter permease [Anaeromonas gelatinilytica]